MFVLSHIMALSHRGLLGGKIAGKTLQIGVCTTAASGFLLFGYDRKSLVLCFEDC